jgi:hypothetical protein
MLPLGLRQRRYPVLAVKCARPVHRGLATPENSHLSAFCPAASSGGGKSLKGLLARTIRSPNTSLLPESLRADYCRTVAGGGLTFIQMKTSKPSLSSITGCPSLSDRSQTRRRQAGHRAREQVRDVVAVLHPLRTLASDGTGEVTQETSTDPYTETAAY